MEAHRSWAQSMIRRGISSLRSLSERQASYLMQYSCVSVRRLRNLRWMRTGISGAKRGDLEHAESLPDDAKEYYRSGKDMVRHGGSFNIAPWHTAEEYKESYVSSFGGWLSRTGALS